jgi:hypothetical protein
MSWTGWATLWLPILLVIIATAMGLAATGSPPATPGGRRSWMAGMILFGLLAVAGSVWQSRSAIDEFASLSGTTASPWGSTEARNRPTISDLTKQVKALEDRVRELQATKQARTITPETSEKMATYLKPFGNHRVILSSIPNDIEAYKYANQILNVFKTANWDARGPEVTKIFGDIRAPGINIYVNGDGGSETVKILLDAFAKFNIPFQGRVAPSKAIPDTETVELFIGAQPSELANTGPD